jgi:hypothetical protein
MAESVASPGIRQQHVWSYVRKSEEKVRQWATTQASSMELNRVYQSLTFIVPPAKNRMELVMEKYDWVELNTSYEKTVQCIQ